MITEKKYPLYRGEADKRRLKTKSLHDYVVNRFGKDKLAEWQRQADRKAEILLAMHALVKASVDEYMQEQKVGFNELVKRLHVSPTYVSKMRKGQANLTFVTFAHVMGTLGKNPSEFLKIKK